MIQLRRYFSVPFRDPNISLDELVAFATDHLQRLVANNPGAAFNTLITATTVALTTLGNCSSSDLVKLGIRKAAKDAKDAFRTALPGNLRKISGKVAGQYGEPSAELTQCFPQGRTVFTTCADDALDEHLQSLVAALTPLVGVMGPDALADAGGLLSTWLVLYGASETATGSKTATEAEKRAARTTLERQLAVNLLTLALHFLDQEDKADTYFQQHLLEDHPAQEEDPPPPPP